MLLYSKVLPPKPAKRRSRAGCINCKEKKKKCDERPTCSRCIERGIPCAYEPVKPRKRRRSSLAISHDDDSALYDNEHWSGDFNELEQHEAECFQNGTLIRWDGVPQYKDPSSDSPLSKIDDIEEIVRPDLAGQSVAPVSVARSRSQYPDLAMIAPCPVTSPLLGFRAPVFEEFTQRRNRRALVDHFCNVLSHLIVFKEDTGNPFQQLVLPLSHSSSPVLNAIFALSSAHLEYRGVVNEEKSLYFHNRALQGLAELIDQNEQACREEVLAAIILLVYYEVLVQRGVSIVSGHLKGAMTVMNARQHQESSPTSAFLERAFGFYDIITALSFGNTPNLVTLPPTYSVTAPPCNRSSSVDTLLGMATDLWPILHRLSQLFEAQTELRGAELCGNTSKATVLRTELQSTSQAIEIALKGWNPPISPISTVPQEISSADTGNSAQDSTEIISDSVDEAEDARMQSILNNAEAYRQAALVYLYRDIQCAPRTSEKVQRHTYLALQACGLVTKWAMQSSGPMSALLWPLFVASCQAISVDHRELATCSFLAIEKKQGMNNIVRAWEVVEEVWRRGDEGRDDSWRTICAEKGYSIVFG